MFILFLKYMELKLAIILTSLYIYLITYQILNIHIYQKTACFIFMLIFLKLFSIDQQLHHYFLCLYSLHFVICCY